MTLSTYVADLRARIFRELQAGTEPTIGTYDADALRGARAKGQPQMGATRYRPDAVLFEFPFQVPSASALIVVVEVPAPERIVFMPVPDWVVENIWQGDVDGTYRFESEAQGMLAAFERELEDVENRKWFGPRPPKRRE